MLLPHCSYEWIMMANDSGGNNSKLNLTIGWPVPVGIYNNSNLTVTPLSSYDAQPLGLSYFEINPASNSTSLAILVIFDLHALPTSIRLNICSSSSPSWSVPNSSTYSNISLPNANSSTTCTQSTAFSVPPLCGKHQHHLDDEEILPSSHPMLI